jgi:hypothetical protein
MRRSDSRPPISPHFVAFDWRYHPCARFAPSGRDARPWARGDWCSGSRAGYVSGDGRGSQVPGDPSCALALFFDPGGIGHARPSRRADAVPAADKSEDSHNDLSRLNRTAWALAVYASQGESPLHHARLASGCWPSSAGWDSLTHRVPMKGFGVRVSSSFPKLLGAMSVQFRPWGVVRKRSGRRGPSNEAMQRTRSAGR